MRRNFLIAAVVALVALVGVSAWAQETTQTGGGVCCKAVGGETTFYPMLGTCPPGTTLVASAECGIIPTPTPVVVPTVAPTPSTWEPPKEAEVPSWLTWLFGLLANKYTLPIGFGAIVIAVVAGFRQILGLFGGKLGPKATYLAAALMAFLTALGDAVADGKIAGQEWTVLLTTLATFVAAILGYKLLFSGAARTRLGK